MKDFHDVSSSINKILRNKNTMISHDVSNQCHTLEINQDIMTLISRMIYVSYATTSTIPNRQRKILFLKDSLDKGFYKVKYEKIAEKIILHHISELILSL